MKAANLNRLILIEASKRGHRLFINARGTGWVGGKTTRNRDGTVTLVGATRMDFGLGPDGASDLIGWCKDGVFAAVETKTANDKIREGQPEFIEAVRKAGGRAGFAWSVEDAIAILEPIV